MKLLLSCYECSPIRGSECGVGWNWAYEARRMGHDVWCLVAPTYEGEIRKACETDPLAASIHWIFPQSPLWRIADGYRPKAERRHNLLWQLAALKEGRRLSKEIRFDVVHQVTWGGLRVPSFLWKLPAPFIVGPVGGGETSPTKLRDAFSLKNRVTEWVRDFSNATIALNPPVRRMLNAATVIAAKTSESRGILPPRLRRKTVVHMEIGVSPDHIEAPRTEMSSAPRILFAGRLLYWKGAHLALHAFARIRQNMPDAQLTIVGSGPEHATIMEMVARYGLKESVSIYAHVDQSRLFEMYKDHDIFLFPSLHDSSGNVVLESLCRGLPVVCLDLGGPKEIVNETCGVSVGTEGLSSDRVADSLAYECLNILVDEERWEALSAGAIARAKQFLWSDRVTSFYRQVEAIASQVRSDPVMVPSMPPSIARTLSDAVSASESASPRM